LKNQRSEIDFFEGYSFFDSVYSGKFIPLVFFEKHFFLGRRGEEKEDFDSSFGYFISPF